MTTVTVSCEEAASRIIADLRCDYPARYLNRERMFSEEVYLTIMGHIDRFLGGNDEELWCAVAREVCAENGELNYVQRAKIPRLNRVRRAWANALAFDSMLVLLWRKLKK